MSTFNKKLIASGLMAVCLSAGALSANAESSDKDVKDRGEHHEMRRDDDRGEFKLMGRDERGERDHRPGGPEGFGPRGMGLALHMLDLSEEQMDKITDIRDKARKDDWAIRGDMMDVNNTIRDLSRADEFDRKALSKAFAELAELQKKTFLLETNARLNVMAVLTDEQRLQLREPPKRQKPMDAKDGKDGKRHS